MIQEVPINKVRPNPYCTREKSSEALSEEAIDSLADEIKTLGWWGGSFKARQRNGVFELAFGKRRLAALKKLGHKTLTLDVERLTDEQMKLLMAAENFQRHSLTEWEKLAVWEQVKELMGGGHGSTAKAARLLGISDNTASDYNTGLKYRNLKSPDGDFSARAMRIADALGGEQMVKVAAEKKLHQRTLEDIRVEIHRADEAHEAPKAKLIDAAKHGRILHADDVKRVAREIKMEEFTDRILKAREENAPDLMEVVKLWVEQDLPEMISKIGQVASKSSYADYIVEGNPKLASRFKALLKDLVRVVDKLERNIIPRLEAK